MNHHALVTLVAIWCCFCCGIMAKEDNDQHPHPRELPCPPAEDISPCVCTVIDSTTFDIQMDCSSVVSNTELADIFSQDFPYKNFHSLVIYNNYYLSTIRAGDLGENTFKNIYIEDGTLETIQSNAFMSSHDTLISLEVRYTNLNYFPFGDIWKFTLLRTLDLRFNELVGFQVLASTVLTSLYLDGNYVTGIDPSSLPAIVNIGLYDNEIIDIPPGTFTGLYSLHYINLSYNRIQALQTGTFHLYTSINNVYLHGNDITYIAEGALVGMRGILKVEYNELTELAEGVFRPNMEDGASVYAEGNPLDCSCEIAWLVTNPTYMDRLIDDPVCSSGEHVSELNPDMFLAIC